MKFLLPSLLLCALAAGGRSQVTLRQPGAAQVKPSQTLSLTCSVSGFSLTTSGIGVGWIRQPPGKGLEWLCHVWWNEDKYYQDSLKSRLSISRDTSKGEVYLEMRSLEAGDSGTYYCASPGNWFDYWGQGTMVTVTSVSPKAPSVFPLTSCSAEATTSQVTFGCLVKGYFPEPVSVEWSPSIGSTGLKTYPSMKHTSGDLYSLSSQATVPASSWESNTYRCNVKHEPTSSTITKEIPKPASVQPTVQVYHSSCTTKPSTIHLLCLISGFYPMPLTVEWLVDGVSGLLHGVTGPAKKDAGSHTYSTHSNASISQDDWMEDKTYTCKVSHQGNTVEDQARKCKDLSTSTSNILIFMVPPPPSELYVGLSPMLTCLVVNLPNDADLKVVWSREKSGPISPEPLVLSEQRNRTFTASSSLAIFPRDWEAGEKYTCKVEHSELPSPIIKSISKKQGKSSLPRVYLLRPHPEELSNNGDSVSLTCLVRGFFPEDISVKWMQDHQSSDSNKSVTTSPMKEGDGDSTYFLYSKMTVDKANWNNGATYTCMVIHEALTPMKFTQRNIRHVPEVILSGEFCAEDDNEELNSLWSTISVFITLFLLSVCYSATVTLFKVKWFFASMVQMKQARGPQYTNVFQRVV